jgi:hypothetical protein
MIVFLSDIEDIPENREIQPYMFEPPVRVHEQYVESEEEASSGEELDRRLNTIWSRFSFKSLYWSL